MSTLEHALVYAARGCPVFPCKATTDKSAGSKAPHLPGESKPCAHDGGHWLASVDEGVIRGWWKRWPSALIGFPTGLRTQCVVVDLDPREHSTKAMLAALTRFCGHLRETDPETGEVVEPVIARTQSGGLHLYFAWPDEATFAEVAENLTRLGKPNTGLIGNKANLFTRFLRDGECPAELAHVDVRGEGGYVIAPPSVMADGKRYEWLLPQISRLPALPRRLRGVITGEFLTDAERALRRAARSPAGRQPCAIDGDRRVKAYIERAIDAALQDARTAPEGERNQRVFEAAVSLSRFTRSGHLDKGQAEALLLANLPAGVSPNEHKIRGTIASGLSADRVPAFSPEQLGPGRSS
ncbi:bifunctional DNA primase/polymerase [Bosea sp. F3-2]|uniref:bifunctional DNA primase/polymerase n=1 Tax=Bosea sp. F3-2 TaxID=2599640 RepID=UPI0011ED6D46|nr:bifunctional DNA primase/polymerase [Bosea sp. F3-2]QEL26138.1 bifunctional DNA primase/polymerase [Bosea sp. F3-2]